VPEIDDILMPVLAIIPAYLLTYYLALALKREIDQPRNLAKSVTVE
jgi:glucosamine--fructose-6-phosphate aminotransferase (isomerizing)